MGKIPLKFSFKKIQDSISSFIPYKYLAPIISGGIQRFSVFNIVKNPYYTHLGELS